MDSLREVVDEEAEALPWGDRLQDKEEGQTQLERDLAIEFQEWEDEYWRIVHG